MYWGLNLKHDKLTDRWTYSHWKNLSGTRRGHTHMSNRQTRPTYFHNNLPSFCLSRICKLRSIKTSVYISCMPCTICSKIHGTCIPGTENIRLYRATIYRLTIILLLVLNIDLVNEALSVSETAFRWRVDIDPLLYVGLAFENVCLLVC